jgi:Sulfotransferase family
MPLRHAHRPIFFFHVHKCGGTTFVNLARANGHRFVSPNASALPLQASSYGSTWDPFCEWNAEPLWEFWHEPFNVVCHWRDTVLGLGVDFIAQEYGRYDPKLWEDFFKVCCIRHPVNRLASTFAHERRNGSLSQAAVFETWAEGPMVEWWAKNLLLEHFGGGNTETAVEVLLSFDVIVIQDISRKPHSNAELWMAVHR